MRCLLATRRADAIQLAQVEGIQHLAVQLDAAHQQLVRPRLDLLHRPGQCTARQVDQALQRRAVLPPDAVLRREQCLERQAHEPGTLDHRPLASEQTEALRQEGQARGEGEGRLGQGHWRQ